MAATEDDDLLLQRASAYLLENLKSSLPRLLWKRSGKGASQRQVHRWARPRILDRIVTYVSNV